MVKKQYINDVCHSRLPNINNICKTRSKMYEQSFLVFQDLHQVGSKLTVDEAGKKYGDVLKEQLDFAGQRFYDNSFKKERDTILELSHIWQLCEILYFNKPKDDTALSIALMEWFNKANKRLSFEYNKQSVYFDKDEPFAHPDFWLYAIRMAMLGHIDQLAALFSHVLFGISLSRYNDILPFIIELRNMATQGHFDIDALKKSMTSIRSTHFIDPEIRHHADQICVVMAILSGNHDVILQHAQSDIHAYICYKYYQPLSTGSFSEFVAEYSATSPPNALRALLMGDIYQTIELSVQYDWWLLAHLTDLLMMKNLIDKEIQIPVGNSMVSLPVRSHFILYYASFLKNEFGLWRISFDYMLTCGDFGRDAIVEHLSTMDLDIGESVLQEMVQFCNKNNLQSKGTDLYKRKADLWISTKDYKQAIHCYIASDQIQYIDSVFEQIIDDYAKTGLLFDIACLEPANYNGPYYTIYQHLSKLCTFIKEDDKKQAAKEFNALIRDESLPDTIIPIIIWLGLDLIRDKYATCFTKSDLIQVKTIWQRLNSKTSAQDFELFHYYLNRCEPSLPGTLIFTKREFLDTTAVCFSRALDRL